MGTLTALIEKWLTVAIVACSPFAGAAQTHTIVVPKEQANSFGDRMGVLFGQGGFAQVYDPAEFAEIPGNVIAITALGFRWDEVNAADVDVNVPRISLGLCVSDYKGATFGEYVRGVVPAFEVQNAHLTAPANRPAEQFDLVFPLQKPFIYDRRRGALVLRGLVSTISTYVDAQSTWARHSFFVLPESRDSDPHYAFEVMVTQFSYLAMPLIDSVRQVGNDLEIRISAPPGAAVQIQSAESVAGPYTTEEAELMETSPGNIRGLVPMRSMNRFYRISME